MEISSSNRKKIVIFSKESFSYISGNGTLHFSSQTRKNKKILAEKTYYISENRTFLCFGKVIFRTRSSFRTLIYLETETYSEQCQTSTLYIANLLTFPEMKLS